MLVMAKRKSPWPARLRSIQSDLSNQAMADKLGVSIRTYLSWKYGVRLPSGPSIQLIKRLESSKDWQAEIFPAQT